MELLWAWRYKCPYHIFTGVNCCDIYVDDEAGGREAAGQEGAHSSQANIWATGVRGAEATCRGFFRNICPNPLLACLPACLPGQYLHLGLLGSSTSQALSQIVTCK